MVLVELDAAGDPPPELDAEDDGQIGRPQLVLGVGLGGTELLGGADVVGTALVLGAVLVLALLLGAVLDSVGVGVLLLRVGVLLGVEPFEPVICWVVGSGTTGLPSR